jgi:hypothetical protein
MGEHVVVTVTYPPSAANDFNLDYYFNNHLPSVDRVWGPSGLLRWTVARGEKDGAYFLSTALVWKNMDAYKNANGVDEIMGDITNFTKSEYSVSIGTIVKEGNLQ